VTGIGFSVVNQMDIVPTPKALEVELERQTYRQTVGSVLWEPKEGSDQPGKLVDAF
jgi:hypothetical protein